MVHFVTQAQNLYGKDFLVYNIYSLLHLADEAKEHGSLDACSAFPFENFMHKLKRLVRLGNKPMTQIVKRLCERSKYTKLQVNMTPAAGISLKSSDNAYVLDNDLRCEAVSASQENHFCAECMKMLSLSLRSHVIHVLLKCTGYKKEMHV